MKTYQLFLTSSLLLLILFSANGKASAANSKSKTQLLNDDGSWVCVIDGRTASKESFEQTHKLWHKINAVTVGGDYRYHSKKAILKKLILIDLTYQKALNDPLFMRNMGRYLQKIYTKQALYEFYIYKSLVKKIQKPDIDELYTFYKNQLKPKGLLNDMRTQEEIDLVKTYYITNKINRQSKLISAQFQNTANIEVNKKVLDDYIKGSISRLKVKQDRYWVIKVNSVPLYLIEILPIIDNKLKEIEDHSRLKNKWFRNSLCESIIANLKQVELGYQAAIEKKYEQSNEGKNFVYLAKKRLMANFYLVNMVLTKIKYPDDAEINSFLKVKANQEQISKILNDQERTVNEQEISRIARQKIYLDKLEQKKQSFFSNLKGSHIIRISKKYFARSSNL